MLYVASRSGSKLLPGSSLDTVWKQLRATHAINQTPVLVIKIQRLSLTKYWHNSELHTKCVNCCMLHVPNTEARRGTVMNDQGSKGANEHMRDKRMR